MALLLIYLFMALAVSFICSILEATLLSTPSSFASMKEDEGHPNGARLVQFKENIDRPIASILSLNTIANTIGAAGVGAQAVNVWGEAYFGIVSAILTLLILVFSEIIPKTLGATYWRQLAMPATSIIRVMMVITYPFVMLSEYITRLFTSNDHQPSVSREELSAMVSDAAEEGVIPVTESQAIQSFIHLVNVKAEQIMTPDIVVAMADEKLTLKEFFANEEFKPFSRIPVYAESRDYITGYILKDEVLSNLSEDKDKMTLSSLVRPILSFTEDASVSNIWEMMVKKKEHISIIVDNYGALRGIVTLEDVIETMLGVEIIDELDTATDMQDVAMKKAQRMQHRPRRIRQQPQS
ncbi:MAG: CNNM domain-containing protein [Muribaculum sp.]|nr:CNNM domain-containing protein [Muribaculum sp.]